MSSGEFIVFVIGAAVAAWRWGAWYWRIAAHLSRGFATHGGIKAALAVWPVVCGVALVVILQLFADQFVREMIQYLIGYAALGAGWVAAGLWAGHLLNLRPIADAVSRGNAAAAWATVGLMTGLTLAYAGANVGDGPSFRVVLLCAGLSTVGLFAVWAVIEYAAHAAEHVTVERDTAAGLRLGAALAGTGLILGRAVAGDWESIGGTLRDFAAIGWPALAYAVVEPLVTRLAEPTPQRPRPSIGLLGVVPAAIYLACAVACLLAVRSW